MFFHITPYYRCADNEPFWACCGCQHRFASRHGYKLSALTGVTSRLQAVSADRVTSRLQLSALTGVTSRLELSVLCHVTTAAVSADLSHAATAVVSADWRHVTAAGSQRRLESHHDCSCQCCVLSRLQLSASHLDCGNQRCSLPQDNGATLKCIYMQTTRNVKPPGTQ